MSGNLQEYPSAYNIQNNTWLTYDKPRDGKMYIFMLPTTALKQFGIKKPIDVVSHWALCINGICYELQRVNSKEYNFGWKTEPDFVKYRHEKQNKGIVYGELGYMARLYPHDWIKEVDQWVKAAGNTRDGSFFAIAAGASLMVAGLAFGGMDAGATSAAGFAMAAGNTLRTTAWLITARDSRSKKIKEGQKEIRKIMEKNGKPLHPA
ncbi:hypothetical protein CPLU01_08449 [Colletotrichum plurivorum]|uniref:Uncharacterized protein n=1 Tax=Colletotrichum plurivorum TaxID=2175906 RepID=A0A8H6KC25_9PEZI|nr:hypothetical protein CPLU01_08449 [Colletotrichum plurivorum]